MLKIGDRDEYTRRYRDEIPATPNPDKVLRDLSVDGAGHDTVLLCFGGPGTLPPRSWCGVVF